MPKQNRHQSGNSNSDNEHEMLTHEDDSRIAPGNELPPLDILLNEYGPLSDLFESVDITLLDGDVTDGRISSISRKCVNLSGCRRPFEGWTQDMGISAKFLGTLCQWMDDERYIGGTGTWRTWDEITLCDICYTSLSSNADSCDACEEGEPFTPRTPSSFQFMETHRFDEAPTDDHLLIETSADLVAAILSVIGTEQTPTWWAGKE